MPEAKVVADVTLYNAWVGRVQYQFTVPPKYALLEPTDVITVTKDGAAYLVRLTATKLVRNGMQEISGIAEDVSSYDFYNPAGTGTPNLQPPATISATRLELMDLPAFPTDGVTDAYLRYGVVGLGDNWAGSAVYRSDDGGSNYALMQTLTAQATIGAVLNIIPAGTVYAWDNISTIDVLLTGRVVTGDTKTRKYVNGNTAQWTYLRCWNPDQPEKIMWVREEEIIKQVEDIISRLGIREKEFLDTTIEYMKEMNRLKKEHHTIEVAQLKKEHTEIQAKLDRLMDLRLNDELTKEEFESGKRRLKDRQYELTDLINTYDKADDEFTKRMEWLLTLTHKAPELWAGSTISQKRELLNFLFANLKLKGATLCYELRKPFDDFLDGTDCPKWRRG